MNCLHYQIPASRTLRRIAAHLPECRSEAVDMKSAAHLSCHRLLQGLARRLEDLSLAPEDKATAAETADEVLAKLSRDDRVKRSLAEFYGIRLLRSDLRQALRDQRRTGDPGHLRHVGAKLRRELEPYSPSVPLSQPADRASAAAHPTLSLVAAAGRVAAFLVLLAAAVATMLTTALFTVGVG